MSSSASPTTSISTTPSSSPETIRKALHANLLQVFNERNADTRASAIANTYADNVVWFEDNGAVIHGREALHKRAQELLDQSPGWVFVPDGEMIVCQNLGILNWKFGPPGEEGVVKGIDTIIVEGERIRVLWTALTKTPGA